MYPRFIDQLLVNVCDYSHPRARPSYDT
jgi:hypothetical protein